MFLHHHPKELPIFTHVSDPIWEKGQCVTAGNIREDRPSSLRINMTRFGSWILLSWPCECLALSSLTCTWSSLPPKAVKGWRGAKPPIGTGIESCLTIVGSLSPSLSLRRSKKQLKKVTKTRQDPYHQEVYNLQAKQRGGQLNNKRQKEWNIIMNVQAMC